MRVTHQQLLKSRGRVPLRFDKRHAFAKSQVATILICTGLQDISAVPIRRTDLANASSCCIDSL